MPALGATDKAVPGWLGDLSVADALARSTPIGFSAVSACKWSRDGSPLAFIHGPEGTLTSRELRLVRVQSGQVSACTVVAPVDSMARTLWQP